MNLANLDFKIKRMLNYTRLLNGVDISTLALKTKLSEAQVQKVIISPTKAPTYALSAVIEELKLQNNFYEILNQFAVQKNLKI